MIDKTSEQQAQPIPSETPSSTPGQHITNRRLKQFWRSAFALLAAVAISAAVLVISKRVEPRQFARYGYPGAFLISLLGNATIIFPTPSLAIVSIVGSVLNPFLVGLCAGIGEALGEMTGYLAGYSGRAVVENREHYAQLVKWTRKHGLWVILTLSIFPNPLFDLAGIAAGALKIPPLKFLLVCWIGKTIKTILFALGGRAIIFAGR